MAGNPFDQFDPSASSAASSNPFDQFDTGAKAAPAQSSGGKGNAYQPTWLDKVTNVANPTLGLSDIVNSGVGSVIESLGGVHTPTVAEARAQRAQQASELGPITSTAASILGYGPMGAVLGPAGATASLAGRPIAQAAAEGALAGGISNLDSSNPISSAGTGALGGAALGGAAGVLTHGANAGLQKAFGKPGTVDPAAAIASTAKDSADAYAALHQKPADPQAITGAIKGVLTGLDPSVVTGMSPGLKSTILDIGQTVQNLPEANMGQLNSWSRQIDAAAQRERYPTDQVVAGKITSAFDDLMQKGGAGDLNAAAQSAAQKNIMAEKLAEWQEKVNAGAPLGQAPLTEAEWYKNQPDKQKSLVDLYQANQGGVDPSYTAAHLGSEIGGTAGYAVGGFPGHLIGKSAGYYLGKTAGKKWKGNLKSSGQTTAIQSLYPGMTGIQPTGAVQGPQVGDMIKNLMLGTAF